MAKVIETVERDGKQIAIYDNGMERDVERGRIVKPPADVRITAETSRLMHQRRAEKAAALLRKKILEAHNKQMNPVTSSAAAFADSGALLYEEIVLNDQAYPRDRLDAWQKLGQYAEVIEPNANKRQSGENNSGDGVVSVLRDIADIARAFTSTTRHDEQVIDAD